MKAQDLKNSILQLAMEGKLVPQNPDDVLAKELLTQIDKKKEQLIKDKKIKRKIKESVIFRDNGHFYEKIGKNGKPVCIDDEIPFDIPNNWEWVRLGEVTEITMGQSPPGDSYNQEGIGTPLINGPVEFGPNPFSKTIKSKFTTAPKKMCNEGDLILCVRGSTTGRMNISGFEACIGRGVASLRSFLQQGYLNWFIHSIQKNIFDSGSGSTFPNVTLKTLNDILIPVPSLEEQIRIVDKIEELLPYVEEYGGAQEKLDELNVTFPEKIKASILQTSVQGKLVPQNQDDVPAKELLVQIKKEKEQLIKDKKIKRNSKESVIFRDNGHFYEKIGKKGEPVCIDDEIPFDIPDTWEWACMNQFVDVRDGTHDTPKYVNEGVPLVTSKNLKKGKIDFSNIKYISKKDHENISKRSAVDDGDILFAMIGSIGNPIIVSKDRDFSIKNVALFKPYISALNLDYLLYFLIFAQYNMQKIALGAVQSFVSLKVLRNYYIPIPPLEEQERIVKKIEELIPYVENMVKLKKN